MRKIVLSVFTVLIMSFQLMAQNQRVTGTVTDQSGQPLMGATVVVKGTQAATATGLNGEYTIDAPVNDALIFSFLGFADQEIKVTATSTVINVKLAEDNEQIEQVVVIGYGSARSVGSVTGSVSVVDAEILNDQSVMNAADALSGQVSGMSVMTSSGEPAATSSIRIHGAGSLSAGNSPLYVIDGVPSSAAQFLAMNSNDIESMVTLKDASATSIYGSRAANGVIYITTKKGARKQNASFRLSGSYGFAVPVANRYEQMSGPDLLKFQKYFHEINNSEYNDFLDLYNYFGATDWFRYIYKTAPSYNGEFSVAGGSETISYYLSGSYMNQDGMAPSSGMERYTMRANISAQATPWMRIDFNMAGSSAIMQTTQSTSSGGSLNITSVTNFPVYMPSYMTRQYLNEITNEAENYRDFPNGMIDPYYVMEKAPEYQHSKYLNGNFALRLTPVRGLTISSINGLDGQYNTIDFSGLPSHFALHNAGQRARQYSQGYTLSTSNTVEYRFDPFADKHNLTLLVGQEGISYNYDSFFASSTGLSDDRIMLLGYGTQITMQNVSETIQSYNMLSFFGRANYDYMGKYSLDLTLRNDASSKFGRDNRNALFYAIGGMWNIKRENFLIDNRVLTDLKLRVTYGTSGNSDIGLYGNLALIASGLNYGGSTGKYFATPGNQAIGWESQSQFNVGLEFGLWNWLAVEASYYDRQTYNMLYSVPYPPSSGITARTENTVRMFNRGVDLDIDATLFHNKNWNITLGANFNYNLNRITHLYTGATELLAPDYMRAYVVGESAWNYYLPVFMGVDPADGKPMYDDGNGNAVKDTNLAGYILTDKARIAPYSGGFNFDIRWKGLMVQANFAYQIGKWLLNGDRFWQTNTTYPPTMTQRPEDMKNIWRNPGDITDIPAYGETTIYSTQYLEDASFLRLKNLVVSYQLPQSVLRKTGFIKGVKLSCTMRNLFTITKFTGYDPEYDSNIAYGMYPNTNSYTFGLELTF